MYSPRLGFTVANTNRIIIPESCGVAIPDNANELLHLLQQQHKRNLHKIDKNSNIVGRIQKQEQQRECYETKMMEFEDFIYKAEGKERLSRHFEHMQMYE